MSERVKITSSHLSRQAFVYLRQSSAAQVEHNRESTDRQYALAGKARDLGWPDERIIVIDEDLGLSGLGSVARSGFARLTAEVALARVGLVLGLEVSRLARNNAEWYRLIDLAGFTDTLIGDADGIYHSAVFNDRLLLRLKGTMSEAELHVLRARLNGESATRRRGVNCAAGCRSASSGARLMARSASILTKLSSSPFAVFLHALPRWDRRVAFGSGFVPRGSRSRCSCTPVPRSVGSRQATPPSTRS
ncbi:recombinase family protein [Bradyrhizobium sp. GCM10027634]|uniref:Recombinase family protein n=1 Tax=Bradyrhizobium zhengyangense TaxID=2911009 RepID=A0ABS9M1A0_9BRAD|nr:MULTISPECIES: recombinase family protein [Bradyrhizobium]MCG2645498.1 recombinase family protein [Bradyrhizobium zhengyangense]MCG2673057.1 recombinase family protein [Bradyrhizobium zhengyangense]MDN4984415.1 recombinase family protein [Bradyrhizobium sp. WYCCWR 13022]MDN5002408.1 recombinase family protein [Bradyrhizobium sp. WYCCWR 12677]MDT4736837.1 recombinase family protein [Bradyrhizobium sp. WYCCWR 12699]